MNVQHYLLMKKYLPILILLLSVSFTGFAQNNQVEFQTALIGSIHSSAKSGIRPLSEFGINYQPYLFPRTYLVLALQGNSRNYQENSKDTLNPFTGNLKYDQWMASVGVRHLFKEEIIETFNYFAEVGFHYSRLKTEGEYKDGGFGSAYYRFNRFKGVGFNFKLGSVYQFNSPWYVGANFGLYLSGGKFDEQSNFTITPEPRPIIEDLLQNETLTRFALEIRVGYRFWK